MSKNQAIILRRQAGTLRRTLEAEMRRLSPFSSRYNRIELVLEKVQNRYQRRLKIERGF